MLDTHMKKHFQPAFEGAAKLFLRFGLTPDTVTYSAFIVGITSGVFIYFGHLWAGVAVLWFSGFLDAVDGTMARLTKTSAFGTILDVSFDRLVEASVIIGLAFRYPAHMGILLILTVSILFGMTVFLTIGAAVKNTSNKTFHYAVGLAERTEGFIFLTVMALFPDFLFYSTALFIAVEIVSTLFRLYDAKKQL